MIENQRPDLTRATLQVLWIGLLIAATFSIMQPFIPSLIWAAMIAAATWPLMLKVEGWLWGRRSLAVAVMTVFMLLIFIIPFWLAIVAIFDNTDRIAGWLRALETMTVPAAPGWLGNIPLAGPKLADAWTRAAGETGMLSASLAPYGRKFLRWFFSQAGSVGLIAVQFLLTVIIAAVFYSKGEVASRGVVRLARRLGGDNGEEVAVLAAKTVRSVALGVVGTALIQSSLGGIGLVVAGVPGPILLTALMFMLCIAQIPIAIVLIPAIIWLYYNSQATWGTIFLVWSLFVGSLDNVLRPILIRKGAHLPLLLIFAGVIGGLITFGVVGLFVGPVVLAITFKLLKAWVDNDGTA